MREIYKEKDFVQYVGKLHSKYDYSKEIVAQIGNINKYDKFSSVELTIIQPLEKIDCLVDLIRPIFTEKKHLINLEFSEIDKDNSTIYKLGDLTISRSSVKIPQNYIDLGFCLGDLSSLTSDEVIRKYLNKDSDFNFEKFYEDYPNLNNINDLINEYYSFFEKRLKNSV